MPQDNLEKSKRIGRAFKVVMIVHLVILVIATNGVVPMLLYAAFLAMLGRNIVTFLMFVGLVLTVAVSAAGFIYVIRHSKKLAMAIKVSKRQTTIAVLYTAATFIPYIALSFYLANGIRYMFDSRGLEFAPLLVVLVITGAVVAIPIYGYVLQSRADTATSEQQPIASQQ